MGYLRLTYSNTQKVPPRAEPILVNINHIRYVLPDSQGGSLLYVTGTEMPLAVEESAKEVGVYLEPANASSEGRARASTVKPRRRPGISVRQWKPAK